MRVIGLLVVLSVALAAGVPARHDSMEGPSVVEAAIPIVAVPQAGMPASMSVCVTPELSRLYYAVDPGDPRTGTAIDAVLSPRLGESPRGQVLQRVRGDPGGDVRRVRAE